MSQILVQPYGEALLSGRLKTEHADFQVDEQLGFDPSGDGEHFLLWVEKWGVSTHELIQLLARQQRLNPDSFSYSGLKDKHALTRQWLSLHLPGKADPELLIEGDGYRILRQARHHRKLRHGTHKGNVFRLLLRDVSELPEQSLAQIEQIKRNGFANYFGHQRFGQNRDNVETALQQLDRRKLGRARRGMLISSLRSFLFNAILSRRIELGYWDAPLQGDVFMMRGSRSIFSDDIDARLLERYHLLDISSTGSLYGSGRSQLTAMALQIEQAIFDSRPDITGCLDRQRAALQMRPLRVAADDLSYRYQPDQHQLSIEVSLPAGSYVTSLLDHFVVCN